MAELFGIILPSPSTHGALITSNIIQDHKNIITTKNTVVMIYCFKLFRKNPNVETSGENESITHENYALTSSFSFCSESLLILNFFLTSVIE